MFKISARIKNNMESIITHKDKSIAEDFRYLLENNESWLDVAKRNTETINISTESWKILAESLLIVLWLQNFSQRMK